MARRGAIQPEGGPGNPDETGNREEENCEKRLNQPA